MPYFASWASEWWIPVVFVIVAGHITNVCVTLFLHRSQTHRSVKIHSLAAVPMRVWLWMSTSIITKEWVACHRKHHAFADREGDPHSPLLEGLRNTRIVRVVFDNPISPLIENDLTISDLASVSGQEIENETLPVVPAEGMDDGMQVRGTVFGADGQPVPFALKLRAVHA